MPAAQLDPPAQAWPHEPQLALSVIVSTHDAPQLVVPVVHVHVPPVHVWPLIQAWPHDPQLLASVVTSRHAIVAVDPLPTVQTIRGAGHAAAHALDTHDWPVVHACAHDPQLFGSLVVLTHALPQLVVPALQPMQLPPTHCSLAAQA